MVERAKVRRLPDEVVGEMLSWLPIQYLSPLRFLSKYYFELLTKDLHFAKLHFDHSLKIYNPCIITQLLDLGILDFYLASEYSDCHNPKIVNLPTGTSHCQSWVYGICNGLICLYNNVEDHSKVYIWNPCIGDHITIPVPCPKRKKKAIDFGFGFHQALIEYKVIRFFGKVGSINGYGYNVHPHISVYTLGVDSSWRALVEDSRYEISSGRSSHVNGVLYWFAKRRTVSSLLNLILVFDIKDEVFHEMLTPVDTNSDHLVNLGGMLSIFSGDFPGEIQVWVMKEYGVVNSWTKQFKILPTASLVSYHIFSVLLAAYQNGEIIIWYDYGKMVVYNPETTSYRKFEEFGFKIGVAYAFIGSIISPPSYFLSFHIYPSPIVV